MKASSHFVAVVVYVAVGRHVFRPPLGRRSEGDEVQSFSKNFGPMNLPRQRKLVVDTNPEADAEEIDVTVHADARAGERS
jgi:hypothetical protein